MKSPGTNGKDARRKRLEEALRNNLRRRKQAAPPRAQGRTEKEKEPHE